MTTTGAAKYNHLLKTLNSRILIVEEAAEVMEAHIVTSLTKHCQHLILIGDHQQLRPSTNVYELATKYNLDVSLFERMIRNNIIHHQLKVQHRMRPEISDLIRGPIYQELEDAPNVIEYKDIKGMQKNVFFLMHRHFEKSIADTLSKSNDFEADFLTNLCRHLLYQGYAQSDITVLSTYTGQMFLLKKKMHSQNNFKDIKITCVDNYQGEENDVILLSLVRSNEQESVGYLNVGNRICVALSRAKRGLYIVGNLELLSKKSKVWTDIRGKLQSRDECGYQIMLKCQIHGTVSSVANPQDFEIKAPKGACTLECGANLPCTHKCPRNCHIEDVEHIEYKCKLACLKTCEYDHPCTDPCYIQPCSPCATMVPKRIPCGHPAIMPCSQNPDKYRCQVLFEERDLSCGHKAINVKCYVDESMYKCKVQVANKPLPCGHTKNIKCYYDPDLVQCKVKVTKKLQCGHDAETECKIRAAMIKCNQPCHVALQECGHLVPVLCKDSKSAIVCSEKCPDTLPCGHKCPQNCHITKDPKHELWKCEEICSRMCTAGHACSTHHTCHKPCPPCRVPINKELPNCNHITELKCYINPCEYACKEPCKKPLSCNHMCPDLCSKPCGPCLIPVEKTIEVCEHVIDIPCGTNPTRDVCSVLVTPKNKSLCGHPLLVRCGIAETALPEELVSLCQEPCGNVFDDSNGDVGCLHECLGTCSSCLGGIFHAKCLQKSSRTLICGHKKKDFNCVKFCPPCNQSCFKKCEHGSCKARCGDRCTPCDKPCPWQCEHKRCNKLCGEECDREPCDFACPLLQQCGHPCLGFCGEPCPPICHCGDFVAQKELIFRRSRFVLLPDCGHSIEVKQLSKLMETKNPISVKTCPAPHCTSVICQCRRFSNILRAQFEVLAMVKNKVHRYHNELRNQQSNLIRSIQDWELNWSPLIELQKWLVSYLAKNLTGKLSSVIKIGNPLSRNNIMTRLDPYTLHSLGRITELFFATVRLTEITQNNINLCHRIKGFVEQVMTRRLPLSPHELSDLESEIDRLFLYRCLLGFEPHCPRESISAEAALFRDLTYIIWTPTKFNRDFYESVQTGLIELSGILRLPTKSVTQYVRPRMEPVLEYGYGHWLQCPDGHVFAISEPGLEITDCPDCTGIGNHTADTTKAQVNAHVEVLPNSPRGKYVLEEF